MRSGSQQHSTAEGASAVAVCSWRRPQSMAPGLLRRNQKPVMEQQAEQHRFVAHQKLWLGGVCHPTWPPFKLRDTGDVVLRAESHTF